MYVGGSGEGFLSILIDNIIFLSIKVLIELTFKFSDKFWVVVIKQKQQYMF